MQGNLNRFIPASALVLLICSCADDECTRNLDCANGGACVHGGCVEQSNFTSTDPPGVPDRTSAGVPVDTDTTTVDTATRGADTATDGHRYVDTDADLVFGCIDGTTLFATCMDFSETDAVAQRMHCDGYAEHGCGFADICVGGCVMDDFALDADSDITFISTYYLSTDGSIATRLQNLCIANGGDPVICD